MIRWTIAGVGAVALAVMTLNAAMPWLRSAPNKAGAGAACPADAKPADLTFTMKNMDDQDVKLSDYKGKVILLDFWATWCGPCKVEIPHFIELQNTYGARGLQVLGVSVDDKPEQLKPFAAEMKFNYP